MATESKDVKAVTKGKKEEKKVPFFAPFVEGEDDEITVGVNGVMYQIQRGVQVEIPESVYNVIMNSERQKAEAARNKRRFKNVEIGG